MNGRQTALTPDLIASTEELWVAFHCNNCGEPLRCAMTPHWRSGKVEGMIVECAKCSFVAHYEVEVKITRLDVKAAPPDRQKAWKKRP